MDDCEIIELFFNRSEKAIAETDSKYGKYCRKIAFNILHDREDTEECVNDTYFRAWNCIPPQKPERLQTFLGKITRNLSINKWEKRTAVKRGEGQTSLVLDELAECIPDTHNSAQIADDMLVRNLIENFLDGLSEDARKIFVRRYWYMSSVKEIAKDFGFRESKVTVTLFRAREKLRKILEKEGFMP